MELPPGFGSALKTDLRSSADFREGVEAFPKRKPSFRGRWWLER